MAPARIPAGRRPISTRTAQKTAIDANAAALPMVATKRKAESPSRTDKVKRSALGNLTNAVLNYIDDGKKGASKTAAAAAAKTRDVMVLKKSVQANNKIKSSNVTQVMDSLVLKPVSSIGGVPQRQTKVMTRAASRASAAGTDKGRKTKMTVAKENQETTLKTKKSNEPPGGGGVGSNNNFRAVTNERRASRRLSNEFELNENEESHYMSALEDCSTSSTVLRLSANGSGDCPTVVAARRKSTASTLSDSTDSMYTISNQSGSQMSVASSHGDITLVKEFEPMTSDPPAVPDGVIDFDRENWDDPMQASHYAMDIFNYLKEREKVFKIEPYIQQQPYLTAWMRTLLVDWMVEVQETFELNHETLYLAVKIVDIYLGKLVVHKEKLQLLGAAALFMACKYDERTPPLIDDFLYICDGAYVKRQLTQMEMDVFRTIGYDLGIPLSYRFLRRYARCAKVAMPELTLARYILEFSLMNYEVISMSDSKIASACLFMALRMNNKTGWNKTLEHYTGYKLSDFESIVPILNGSLHQKPRDANKTVRNKYAHKIFFEVSKIPLLTNEQLFEEENVENQPPKTGRA